LPSLSEKNGCEPEITRRSDPLMLISGEYAASAHSNQAAIGGAIFTEQAERVLLITQSDLSRLLPLRSADTRYPPAMPLQLLFLFRQHRL
jgi:hypothetical protein